MLSTQALREQLDRYESGAIAVEALEEWLAVESWDMRRWVPVGVQQLVEDVQAKFIQHSDGQITSEELRDYLMQRREQLHRSAAITNDIERRRAVWAEAIQQASRQQESISDSQAVPLTLEPAQVWREKYGNRSNQATE